MGEWHPPLMEVVTGGFMGALPIHWRWSLRFSLLLLYALWLKSSLLDPGSFSFPSVENSYSNPQFLIPPLHILLQFPDSVPLYCLLYMILPCYFLFLLSPSKDSSTSTSHDHPVPPSMQDWSMHALLSLPCKPHIVCELYHGHCEM